MRKIVFPALTVLLICFVSCSKAAQEEDSTVLLSCAAPEFLSPGDKVALISPSYYTPMENVDTAAMVLREWGLVPVVGQNVGKTYLGKYAGTPKERLSDLLWALHDPSIKAILCNRGGYGTIQLVDLMPLKEMTDNPKWLIGFSDITTLHGMETRAGVMSIHGTMSSLITTHFGRDLSSTLVRDIIMGTIPQYEIPPHPQNRFGTASGVLVGGNICTFTPLIGTSADATAGKDIILFIEEVEENMHNIDRLFNTLILNGILDRCKGVILGEFTDCEANLDFGSVEEMLVSYLKDYGIPVCCGFPGGHGDVNLPLVMGAPVTLEVTPEGSKLTFDIDGNQEVVNAETVPLTDSLSTVKPLDLVGDKHYKVVRIYNFIKHYRGVRY